MKIKLIAPFFIYFSLCFSQQTLKRISENENEFILELFVLRNGSDNCNVSGNLTFDWASGGGYYAYGINNNGYQTFYNHNPTPLANQSNLTLPNLNLGTEQYIFQLPQFNKRYKSLDEGIANYQGETLLNYTPIIDITTEYFTGSGFSLGTNFANLYYGKIILQKKLNNGNTVPTNLWILFTTFDAYYNFNPPTNVTKKWYGKFDGTTWISQATDIYGNPVYLIPDICTSLSTEAIEQLDNNIISYPNPAHDEIKIQKIKTNSDSFTYSIVDFSGRKLQNGISKFGEKINISGIAVGTYLLTIESQNTSSTLRIIKK